MKTYDPSKFKAFREITGLSHRAFGQMINRSRSWVIQCENGEAFPDVRDLDQLAQKFNVDQTKFWTETGAPEAVEVGGS